jgi:hypothetical protein
MLCDSIYQAYCYSCNNITGGLVIFFARAARAAAPPLLRVHKNAPRSSSAAHPPNNTELGPGICPKSPKFTRIKLARGVRD